jgi:MFS family permease
VLPRVTAPFDSYRALLRRQGYASFAATVFVSRVTGAMFTVTGVLLVLERTGSATLAGLTSAAAVLPGAVSGPLLGAWLDVVARRRVLVVLDQLLSAVALVALVLLAGHAPNWTLPAVAVLYSVTRPFSMGTFFSALAELAGMELLGPASAVEASSLNLAFIVGPVSPASWPALPGLRPWCSSRPRPWAPRSAGHCTAWMPRSWRSSW